MCKYLICFLFLFTGILPKTVAQLNLVPNPSFEQLDFCPFSVNQIEAATGWQNWRESPELFNACATNGINVPNAGFGYQNARTGISMAGLISRRNGSATVTDFREYIGIQLTQPLSIGSKYFVSFYLNLANLNGLASNNLGAHFTTNPYTAALPHPILNTAHVYNSNLVTDTVNWTYCSGSFTADSAYNYICIGNFFADSLTQMLPHPSNAGYYYIDDICVSTDSILCNIITGIDEITNSDPVIYPNPVSGIFNYKSPAFGVLEILDVKGSLVMTADLQPGNNSIDVASLSVGIYFLRSGSDSLVKKLIKL